MKIGFVHSLYDGALPWQPGAPVSLGPFVSRQDAPPFCPEIYFRFPVKKKVTAVVWRARGDGGRYHVSPQLFDWSKLEKVAEIGEFAGESSGCCPAEAWVNERPPRVLICLLTCAENYWEPLTKLSAASKLLPAVLSMSDDERSEFLEKLGQSRNQQTRRKWREDFFIASRWAIWERKRGNGVHSYRDRIADMEQHGLSITLAAFKQRVARLTSTSTTKTKQHDPAGISQGIAFWRIKIDGGLILARIR